MERAFLEIPLSDIPHIVGIPGIIGYFFYKEVAQWVRTKSNGDERGSYRELKRKIDWLYEAHYKFDNDGLPIWYVRKSLESSISKLADNIEKQTEIMRMMLSELQNQRHELSKVEDIVKDR